MVESLQKYRITTGYLLDTAVELADLSKYDGTLTDDNYSDVTVFRNVLATINSAKINSNGASWDANTLTNAMADSCIINLGVISFKYNRIAPDAVSSNRILYQGGKLYDVYENGVWQNPYEDKYVFVMAPSLSGITGTDVHFKFSSNLVYGNTAISFFEFDAGDGLGYRGISSSYDSIVSYSSSGEKIIKMRIRLTNNITLESQAHITVYDVDVAPSCGFTIPTGTHAFFLSSNPLVNAKVSYKSSHSGAVVKPFIYVEGFDNGLIGLGDALGQVFDSTLFKQTIFKRIKDGKYRDLFNRVTLEGKGEFDFVWLYDDALNETIKNNYDVFYVDWGNPYADIRDNAAILVDILDWINGLKQSFSDKNIIVGHSMGGLITRYALCAMEESGHSHQTGCYVSYDSPHLGVNVPVGVQYALRDMYTALYGEYSPAGLLTYHIFDPVISYLLSKYSSTSAKQMMYYYVPANGDATSTYHSTWQNELNSKGFPKGDPGQPIENLAIVNGGPYNGTSGSTILDLKFYVNNGGDSSLSWIQALFMLAAHTDNLDMSFLAQKDAGSGTVCYSHATVTKHWPWTTNTMTIPLLGNDETRTHYSPTGSYGFDNTNSSYLSFGNEQTIGIDGISQSDTLRMLYYNPTFFVPMASALVCSNYQTNFYYNPPTPGTETPFDSYYLWDHAINHSSYSTDYWDWIHDYSNIDLAGPKGVIETGDSFSIVGAPSAYGSQQFASSNNSVVTITSGGTVTVLDTMSVVTIYASKHRGGAYMSKHRTFLTFFPKMNLSLSLKQGNQYTFSATCIPSYNHFSSILDSLVSVGDLQYKWGVKVGSGSISWTSSSSSSFTCQASAGVKTYIYVKLCVPNGREGASLEYIIDRSFTGRFFTDPTEVRATHLGYYFSYQYVTGMSNRYLAVWCNPDYTGTVILPDTVVTSTNTYSVAKTETQTVYGEQVTLYCFDVRNDLALQQAVADVQAGSQPGMIRSWFVQIKGNGSVLCNLAIPVVSLLGPVLPGL